MNELARPPASAQREEKVAEGRAEFRPHEGARGASRLSQSRRGVLRGEFVPLNLLEFLLRLQRLVS